MKNFLLNKPIQIFYFIFGMKNKIFVISEKKILSFKLSIQANFVFLRGLSLFSVSFYNSIKKSSKIWFHFQT